MHKFKRPKIVDTKLASPHRCDRINIQSKHLKTSCLLITKHKEKKSLFSKYCGFQVQIDIWTKNKFHITDSSKEITNIKNSNEKQIAFLCAHAHTKKYF